MAFHPITQKAAPCGAVYPAPMACPFFKGLLSGHAI